MDSAKVGLALSGGGFTAILFGLGSLISINPCPNLSKKIHKTHDKRLFPNKPLPDLPTTLESPQLLFYATNMQTGISARMDDSLPSDTNRTDDLVRVPTTLSTMPQVKLERFVNWGYALTDLGVRKYRSYDLVFNQKAPAWPYPENSLS